MWFLWFIVVYCGRYGGVVVYDGFMLVLWSYCGFMVVFVFVVVLCLFYCGFVVYAGLLWFMVVAMVLNDGLELLMMVYGSRYGGFMAVSLWFYCGSMVVYYGL